MSSTNLCKEVHSICDCWRDGAYCIQAYPYAIVGAMGLIVVRHTPPQVAILNIPGETPRDIASKRCTYVYSANVCFPSPSHTPSASHADALPLPHEKHHLPSRNRTHTPPCIHPIHHLLCPPTPVLSPPDHPRPSLRSTPHRCRERVRAACAPFAPADPAPPS